jgi:hypothetical protein
MPRLRKPTTDNKISGGGTTAPAIHVKLDDSQARKLQGELDKQRERLIHLRDVADESKHLLHEAQRAFNSAESRHLAGRADARSLEVARNALDDARKRHAKASIECEEAERLVSEILPAAITEARNAALAQLRDTLRAETQAKAKQLATVLAQAKGISDELRQLSNAADTYFTVNEMVRLQVSLIGVMDLGEEYGYVSPRAGVPDLACAWLTGRSLEQPTMYSVWLREMEAFLEHSPAELAEADKLNRVTHIAADARRYRECLAREEAQRKLEALIDAQGGGRMPRGTVALD